MPKWTNGWQRARVRGEGTRVFWRGSIQLTLSESEAQTWRAAADAFQVSPLQIVRAALVDWLKRYQAGDASHPLSGQTESKGGQRVLGTYFNKPPSS